MKEVAFQSFVPNLVQIRGRIATGDLMKDLQPVRLDPTTLERQDTGTFTYTFFVPDDLNITSPDDIVVNATMRVRHLPPYFVEGLAQEQKDILAQGFNVPEGSRIFDDENHRTRLEDLLSHMTVTEVGTATTDNGGAGIETVGCDKGAQNVKGGSILDCVKDDTPQFTVKGPGFAKDSGSALPAGHPSIEQASTVTDSGPRARKRAGVRARHAVRLVASASTTHLVPIQPLAADGSVPFDDVPSRRWSDRTLLTVIGVAVIGIATVAAGFLAVHGHSAARSTSAPTASVTTPATTQDGRDLSQVSNDEMETVVAANPDIVPMRLALVERYLKAADGEPTLDGKKAQLQRAEFHAGEAAARATTTADQARAVRYLGWTTALLTDPAKGASLLEQSLVKEPGNPDALWFLATVRFDKLNDPVAAKPVLEQLLAASIDDTQRQAVQAKLDKVNAALAGG